MQIEHWFPIKILYHDVDNYTKTQTKTVVNNEVKKECLNFVPNENLTTSFYHQKNILDNDRFFLLREKILEVANLFAKELGFSGYKKLVIKESWLNLFNKGNYEILHNHYSSFLSGVYYVNSNEKCSNFYFEDHIETRKMWSDCYQHCRTDNVQATVYQPIEGRMILFPSWLIHGVQPNEVEIERISLAFNLDIEN